MAPPGEERRGLLSYYSSIFASTCDEADFDIVGFVVVMNTLNFHCVHFSLSRLLTASRLEVHKTMDSIRQLRIVVSRSIFYRKNRR